jgi:hypothetical protein
MSAAAIARKHFEAAVAEAVASGYDGESTARYMLDCVIGKYLETRSVADVKSELSFVAENCGPDADFLFMRP